VQEVHRGRWVSRFADQLRELARLTEMEACFGPSFREFGGEYGNAVLVRGSVLGARVYPLPGFGEPRSALRCDVEVRGQRATLFVAHLTSWGRLGGPERRRQVACLEQLLTGAPFPFLLAGDLNARPDAGELQPLMGSKALVFCGEPSDVTFPLGRCRLDYVFADPRWEVVEARVLQEGPSDHWPLLAILRLAGATAPGAALRSAR
jgi:endonuclease/exonuclease/phosphatase family metal-dependent hydrolase